MSASFREVDRWDHCKDSNQGEVGGENRQFVDGCNNTADAYGAWNLIDLDIKEDNGGSIHFNIKIWLFEKRCVSRCAYLDGWLASSSTVKENSCPCVYSWTDCISLTIA